MAAQVNVGNVSMLRASWNDSLKDEMRNFPNALHDDRVDAGSRAFNHLNGEGTWAFGSL
jgi:predicted phage terminase large subunit-like protein